MLMLVLASQGPFGPTPLMCLLVPLFLVGPFLLIVLEARALLGDEPTPVWLLTLMALGAIGLGYMLWPFDFPREREKFARVYWVATVVGIVALPVVAVREAWIRERFRRDRSRDERESP